MLKPVKSIIPDADEAEADVAQLRRQCIEGSQRYRAALIAVGHLPATSLHEDHPALRLLAGLFFRPQRQKDKRDKVVLCDLAPYRKPFREWPLPTWPERELKPRTDPITASERASRCEYSRDHSHALARLEALSRVEELIEAAWDEYRDPPPSEEC
jgi:hypothetical protein